MMRMGEGGKKENPAGEDEPEPEPIPVPPGEEPPLPIEDPPFPGAQTPIDEGPKGPKQIVTK
jgi:hypothetical protein